MLPEKAPPDQGQILAGVRAIDRAIVMVGRFIGRWARSVKAKTSRRPSRVRVSKRGNWSGGAGHGALGAEGVPLAVEPDQT